MSSNSEIPCKNCRLWNPEKTSFSCNPDKCEKLSDWLLDHASLGNTEDQNNIVINPEPIQYIV
ncbi:MAG TPA: hypothetical protein VMD05_04630 [Candidatus Nanoarchaeia archaeon]|nr:hypothetical protein [Candidatus Nanoarchaeia archaeon]